MMKSGPPQSTIVDRSQPARRALTRRRILDAGRTLFARQGYSETTIDGITAEAGVGRATFYLHFPGKAEILEAIFEDFRAALKPIMQDLWRHAVRGERSVCDWIEQLIAFLSKQAECIWALTGALNAGAAAYLGREEWHRLALDAFGQKIPAFKHAVCNRETIVTAKAQLLMFQLEGFTTACALGHWHADKEATVIELARGILAFIENYGPIVDDSTIDDAKSA